MWRDDRNHSIDHLLKYVVLKIRIIKAIKGEELI